MHYNEELKNKKTWVLVIAPHRYDEKDNKPMRKMIKFNMPVPPPVIDGRKMKNNAGDARIVWDNLFGWKYGQRDPDINFMMNVQDLSRAIHVKVNFVSLIEKPPKQLKKEGVHVGEFGKISKDVLVPVVLSCPVINPSFEKRYIRTLDDNDAILTPIQLDNIAKLKNPATVRPDFYNNSSIGKASHCDSLPKGDGITDDTEAVQNIAEKFNRPTDMVVHHLKDIRNNEVVNLKLDLPEEDIIESKDVSEKLPRIKVGQRFMEDMTDKHLDPMVKKVVRVEERLTDDRFHMLRSKYVRMFDKKTLDKVPLHETEAIKNFWWCKTYMWRSNGKGVINMGYALYSMDELYSFKKLIDEETIAIKMEIMQWNKRISNEI